MFSVTTLYLHATAEEVEETLRGQLACGGIVELGRGHVTPRQLVEAAHQQGACSGARRLGPLGELLFIDALAEGASGRLEHIAQSRGLRRSLQRSFAALGRAGVSARELLNASERAGGLAGAHGVELARLWGSYEEQLVKTELYDEAMAWRAGCRAIAAGAKLALLEGVTTVETRQLFDWDGAQLGLLDALLARGLTVRVQLPASSELPPQAARALEPTLQALEARHEAQRLEHVEVAVRQGSYDSTCAPTPGGEARHVARRVRDLLEAGTSPEQIVVCTASRERRARLAAALGYYGVATRERQPASALDAPPVKVVLELLALVEEAVPRERFIQLFSSGYLDGEAEGPNGRVPPHEIARALREAGCTDARGDGYAVRLAVWARGEGRHLLRVGKAETICRKVNDWIELLDSLPLEATLERHAARLRAVLDRLQLFQRARAFRRAPGEAATLEAARIIARDQAAVRELEVALTDLPRAAQRAQMATTRFTRARFARLLKEVLAAARPLRGGVRGAAIELCDFAALPGRRVRHLFACGLLATELPTRPPEDALLSDEDRVILNRALGRPALPLAGRATDLSALSFFLSLAAAERVHLSWAKGDEEGAQSLPSPLLEPLRIAEESVVRLAREPIPRAQEARHLDELRARAALESQGDADSRLSLSDIEAASLWPLLRERDREAMERLTRVIEIERRRQLFFARHVEPHPFVGALRDAALLESLARTRLPGRREEPLSATGIETWAACPFKFYLQAVLRVRELEEVDDEVDQRTLGRLTHEVLEQLFRRLAEAGRFPLRAEAADLDLAEEVCDDVIAKWRRTEALGHPALFAVEEQRLRRQLAQLLRAEAAAPTSYRPTHFEHTFGPLALGDVWIKGKIDRIDMAGARALVLDYKMGLRRSYADRVKDEAVCVTGWQLPLYAAATRVELGSREVEARYYSLREAAATEPVREPADLVERLTVVHAAMRNGDYVVRPRPEACERCGLEAVCRVRRPAREAEES